MNYIESENIESENIESENIESKNIDSKNIESENIESKNIILDSDNSKIDINQIQNFTHSDKKLLVKRITDIKNKKCYIKIFKIIHNDNLKYTKNDNGIFFNLNNLSDKILSEITYIVRYYEEKKLINENILKNINNINNQSHDDCQSSDVILSDNK
jgi:hypothetical protein